jgi:hypothetical protein
MCKLFLRHGLGMTQLAKIACEHFPDFHEPEKIDLMSI